MKSLTLFQQNTGVIFVERSYYICLSEQRIGLIRVVGNE